MVSRTSKAPELPGYTFKQLIGQGGFADVFLYQEHRPSRPVAIKVLLDTDIDGDGRRQFDAEANVMAQLSTHPSIVAIYKADVSADGRPYLVMEYCPKPNLSVRYRSGQISVLEALEVGIQVSGAVETAHRAGILHRDIKPHNILTSAYDQPKLTDFGIAVVTGDPGSSGTGLSVPWSPPEMFEDEQPEDPRSDVYSLAATVYTLLAGRSPFEVPGEANDSHTLMSRIERRALPRISRADVPDKLQDVLARGMAKKVEERYASANAFARALQEVQIDLHVTPTRIDVLDASPDERPVDDEDGRTRVQPIAVIRPEGLEGRTSARRARTDRPSVPQVAPPPSVTTGTPPAGFDQTALAGVRAPRLNQPGPEVAETFTRTPEAIRAETEEVGQQETASSRLVLLVGGAVAAVLAIVVGIGFAFGGDGERTPDRPTLNTGPDTSIDPGQKRPDPLKAPTGERVGNKVTFTWKPVELAAGDHYYWSRLDGADDRKNATKQTRVTFTVKPDETGCIAVAVVKSGLPSDDVNSCPRTGGAP